MADKIDINTERFDSISMKFASISDTLQSIAASLTSASNDVKHVAPGLDQVISKLRRIEGALEDESDYSKRVSKNVRTASDMWKSAENSIIRSIPFSSISLLSDVPVRLKDGINPVDGRIEDSIIRMLNYPGNRNLWSQDMWDKYNDIIAEAIPFETENGMYGVISGENVLLITSTGLTIIDYTAKSTSLGATVTKYNNDGSYSKTDFKTGLDSLGWDGKLLVKDKDGKYVPLKLDRTKIPADSKKSYEQKRIGTIAQFGAGVSAEKSLAHNEVTYTDGLYQRETSASVSKGEAHASVYAGLYATSVDENGNVSYHLEPGIAAEIGASYTLFEAEDVHTYGYDNLNVHGGYGVTMGEVGLDANVQAGFVDGDFGFSAKAEAEAILVEVSGDVGFNIAGIEVSIKPSANIGAGAHAEAGYHDGKFSVDVGASYGVGAGVNVEVDASGLINNIIQFSSDVSGRVGDTINAIQEGSRSLISNLFNL